MVFYQKSSLQFIFALLVTVAYIPGFIGAAIPTNWFVLIIACPIIFYFTKTKVNPLVLVFISFVTISLIWTLNFNIAIFFYIQIIALFMVFSIGENLLDIRPIFKGIAFGLGISGVIAILQFFDIKSVITLYSNVTGLFVNPNIYSEISVIVLLALIVLKLWFWIPLVLPGIVLVHSRTALAALGIGLFIILFRKNRLYACISFLFIAAISAYLYKHSFNLLSIQERLNLYKDTISGITLFGHGVGSFEILYPYYATHIDTALARPRFPHNDWLQLMFEFGVFSLPIFVFSANLLRKRNECTTILWAIGFISLFNFPFHVPVSAFIGCLVAGFVNSSDGSIWDNWNNSRSSILERI
jgi:hypothetical protein